MTFELLVVEDENGSAQGLLGRFGSNIYPLSSQTLQDILHRVGSNLEPIVRGTIQDILEIPSDNFWEPVKITTSIQRILPRAQFPRQSYQCQICSERRCEAYRLPCCRQSLCTICGIDWFERESVNCPFVERI